MWRAVLGNRTPFDHKVKLFPANLSWIRLLDSLKAKLIAL
jgi:hypothetical protein